MSSIAVTVPRPLGLPVVFRPSAEEVKIYAEVIAASEGNPPEFADLYHDEAELQLWVWHVETRQPTSPMDHGYDDE